MRKIFTLFFCAASLATGLAQQESYFTNPVIHGDVADPSIIRIDQTYYITGTSSEWAPYYPVFTSTDLVNWQQTGHVFDEKPEWTKSSFWAPEWYQHKGKVYVYYTARKQSDNISCIGVAVADSPTGKFKDHGPVVEFGKEAIDAFILEDKGKLYISWKAYGLDNQPIELLACKLTDDGLRLDGKPFSLLRDDERQGMEGQHWFKKDGYYYISIPEGGVSTGWQTVMRSKNIYGPYEQKRVLEMGSTKVNGPHQGALVDTPEGEWWFYHFQSTEPQGRVVHLQPVVWKDGFPEMGTDYDKNGIGEPMKICRKPSTGVETKAYAPQSSDDFEATELGLQWQFNHNPHDGYWSLTEKPGWLAIKSQKAEKLRTAFNQFTQKTMGYKGVVTVKIDFAQLTPGGRAGIECIGNKFVGGGVIMEDKDGTATPRLYMEKDGTAQTTSFNISSVMDKGIYIRLEIDAMNNKHKFYYSVDNETFIEFGDTFESGSGDWKGSRIGLYSYNTQETSGTAYFDEFTYLFDGPGGLASHTSK